MDTASEQADARGFGISPEELAAWRPFRALEVHQAKRARLPLDEARRWAAAGVPVRDAVWARAVGLSPAELRGWEAHGFNASDACEAKEAAIDLATARDWREAGFILPDAAQLIRDGWTLEAAIEARYAGIHPYASTASS